MPAAADAAAPVLVVGAEADVGAARLPPRGRGSTRASASRRAKRRAGRHPCGMRLPGAAWSEDSLEIDGRQECNDPHRGIGPPKSGALLAFSGRKPGKRARTRPRRHAARLALSRRSAGAGPLAGGDDARACAESLERSSSSRGRPRTRSSSANDRRPGPSRPGRRRVARRRARHPRQPAPRDSRSLAGGSSAHGDLRRLALDHVQRRDLQLCRAGRRAPVARQELPHGKRHRGPPPGLRRVGRGGVPAPQRRFRVRDLGPDRRRLRCVRDRLGVKPLYYTTAAGRFRFASEIKSLLLDPVVARAPNEERLADFLARGLIDHTDQTLYAGIHQLPSRLASRRDAGGVEAPRRWYTARPARRTGSTVADSRPGALRRRCPVATSVGRAGRDGSVRRHGLELGHIRRREAQRRSGGGASDIVLRALTRPTRGRGSLHLGGCRATAAATSTSS